MFRNRFVIAGKTNLSEDDYTDMLFMKIFDDGTEIFTKTYGFESYDEGAYDVKEMLRNNFITQEQYEQARDAELVIYPAEQNTIYAVPYYSGHALKEVKDIFEKLNLPNAEDIPGGYTM